MKDKKSKPVKVYTNQSLGVELSILEEGYTLRSVSSGGESILFRDDVCKWERETLERHFAESTPKTTPEDPGCFDLESVYDAEIAPRMAQIISVCNRHGIPMMASFLYRHSDETGDGEDSYCTTALAAKNGWQPDNIKNAVKCIRTQTHFAAITVTTAVNDKIEQRP